MNRKTNTHQTKHRHFHGQSIIEFALVLPVLLLLIVGAMDFARLFTTKIVLTNAAREGANYLSRNPAGSGNLSAVIAAEAEDLTNYEITPGCSTVSCNPGDKVSVKITHDVNLLFGRFLQTFGIIGGPIRLSSTVEMMVR